MKGRFKAFIPLFIFLVSLPVFSQQNDKKAKKYSLQSDILVQQGKELDREISILNNKIAQVIKKYDLLNTKDIRIVPYQIQYRLGKDYIEMEKHRFIKSSIFKNNIAGIKDVVGIRMKSIKYHISGGNVTKIESRIYERYYNSGETTEVLIVDPSPSTEDTNDILFTHIYKGKKLLDKKKLGEVKNNTASPVRNQIKREFLIPHLTVFYNSTIFIAEAYYKSMKDADQYMADFLKKNTKFH